MKALILIDLAHRLIQCIQDKKMMDVIQLKVMDFKLNTEVLVEVVMKMSQEVAEVVIEVAVATEVDIMIEIEVSMVIEAAM